MSPGVTSDSSFQKMIPLLIEVQPNLARDLNLESLAQKCGYSPFQFHSLLSNVVGETPKKYVERLRLEKAAYKLQITGEPVLDVYLSVGFKNHDTFARAFKRYYGTSPRDCIAPFFAIIIEDTPAFRTSFAIGWIFQMLESRALNRANQYRSRLIPSTKSATVSVTTVCRQEKSEAELSAGEVKPYVLRETLDIKANFSYSFGHKLALEERGQV